MKKFTKRDLKPGMVVRLKDGSLCLVIKAGDTSFLIDNDGYLELEKYTPNLINTTSPDFNINTVYTPSDLCYCVEDLFDTDHLIKIWEREKIVITFEEIAKTLNISSDRLAIKMPNGDEISKN